MASYDEQITKLGQQYICSNVHVLNFIDFSVESNSSPFERELYAFVIHGHLFFHVNYVTCAFASAILPINRTIENPLFYMIKFATK